MPPAHYSVSSALIFVSHPNFALAHTASTYGACCEPTTRSPGNYKIAFLPSLIQLRPCTTQPDLQPNSEKGLWVTEHDI
jgi:hypothetical protein